MEGDAPLLPLVFGFSKCKRNTKKACYIVTGGCIYWIVARMALMQYEYEYYLNIWCSLGAADSFKF